MRNKGKVSIMPGSVALHRRYPFSAVPDDQFLTGVDRYILAHFIEFF